MIYLIVPAAIGLLSLLACVERFLRWRTDDSSIRLVGPAMWWVTWPIHIGPRLISRCVQLQKLARARKIVENEVKFQWSATPGGSWRWLNYVPSVESPAYIQGTFWRGLAQRASYSDVEDLWKVRDAAMLLGMQPTAQFTLALTARANPAFYHPSLAA